jgi:hypothetical protein
MLVRARVARSSNRLTRHGVADDWVSDVKAKVNEKTGIPVERMRIIFAGKQLEDERALGR